MKRIKDSMYTEAHTRPWLSGLERHLVRTAENRCPAKDIHGSRVNLEQILSFEISLDKPRAQGGNQIQSCNEGEDGEPEGSVESWDGWYWI